MRSHRSLESRFAFLAAVASLSLAACGGGGSDDSATPLEGGKPSAPLASPVAGVWAGTVPSNGNRILAVVLEDGSMLAPYTTGSGEPDGLLHGNLVANGGAVSATSLSDYRWRSSAVFSASMSGSYSGQQLSGTIVYSGGDRLSATLIRVPGHDRPVVVKDFQGTWVGEVAQPGVFWRGATALVAGDGSVKIPLLGGCSFVGQLVSRGDASAADLTASFEGGACTGLPLKGVAIIIDGSLTLAAVGRDPATATVATLQRK